jgi:HD-like signal output (HDOD) protein
MIKRRQMRAVEDHKSDELPDILSAHSHENKLIEHEDVEVRKELFEFVLIRNITDGQRTEIESEIQNIRKPHPLLGSLVGNITDSKALYDLVRTDPELVAKIINVANSPLFGLSQPITTVNHAITYLGIVQVKNIATHFALQKSVTFSSKQQQAIYQKIWAASFLASDMVLILAKELQLENAAELSTRCQLSYLGDISILFTHPKTAALYKQNKDLLHRLDEIQKTTQANPAIVGKILAGKWNLPSSISNAIEHGLLPFTDQLFDAELSEIDIQETLICYCCKRLAEIIIYEGQTDILKADSFSFQDTGKIDFYYTEQQLMRANLDKLSSTFKNPAIKSKLQHTLQVTNEKLQ